MELKFIKGIGPKRERLLGRMGISSAEDLLYHFPRRYEDRRDIKTIAQLVPGENNTLVAEVRSLEERRPRKGLTIIKVLIRDETGFAVATWFNQVHIKQRLLPGVRLLLSGRVQLSQGHREILVQDYEILASGNNENPGRIVPFYPLIQGLNQQILRQAVAEVLQRGPQVTEFYPIDFLNQHQLVQRQHAFIAVHQPENWQELEQARRRLIFDEFFLLQLTLVNLRQTNKKRLGFEHKASPSLTKAWLDQLPFALTTAQSRVIQEICADMEAEHCMHRLIQGDVGSGKTAVAAWAILKAAENGFQAALMAPTEILAQQHYETFSHWLEPLGLKVALLKGGIQASKKKAVLSEIELGQVDVVIGTHALLQEQVAFRHLSLLVIDEQHRFGVRQRAQLEEKGRAPDVLVMSATPIPRTLALTLYGDLDISVIDMLPPGRKPVKTICIREKAREKLNLLIQQEINKGLQVYVVCPLIEESEVMDLNNAKSIFLKLQKTFPKVQIGLLHGRMKAAEKEQIMTSFSQGQLQILVSTTVIEVGVNIPKASVMVVEDADRFGLAQLHQLRGRVGRGSDQSFCILVTKTTNPLALKRLKAMTLSSDGFKLAEEDMALRGPGEFFGTRQHGLPEFRIAQLPRDQQILEEARKAAIALLQEDPSLQDIKNQSIKNLVMKKMADLVRI
jgi:ATP-dependent DNA helicase RecG